MTPSIFYNPDDDTDRNFRKPGGGSQPSPQMQRLRSCTTAAMLIRSTAKTDAARMRQMKVHVMGLRLPPSRLAALWSNARDEALFYGMPERAPLPLTRSPIAGVTMPEYAEAAWLVMRAALALLVKVPIDNDRDAEAFVDIVTTSGHVLPKRQQRRVISIARRYVASAIKGRPFATGQAPMRKAA